jgi:hypothetical protein
MRDRISYELFHGPYACPRVRMGQKVDCEYRGREVVVGGLSDGRIQWPYVRRRGARSLILFGALCRAVMLESEVAVAYHWGVSASVVSHWRRALGVSRDTPGTKRLAKHYMAKLETISKSPEVRRAKSIGMKRKIRQGTWHPASGRAFTAEEIALLGTGSDRAIALALGRHTKTIHWKRNELGIPPYRDPERANPRRFTAREIKLLGTDSDEAIATALGRNRSMITTKRIALGIPSSLAKKGEDHRPFTPKEIALLGTDTDPAIARSLDRNPVVIRWKRVRMGIPAFRPMTPPRTFTEADIALLGTDTDRAIGAILGRDSKNVHWKRVTLGIPAYKKPKTAGSQVAPPPARQARPSGTNKPGKPNRARLSSR